MRRVGRLGLAMVGVLGVARAAMFLDDAAAMLPTPLEVYHLEAKMVHLAWRFRAGVRPYPDWHDGPYVANLFGPVYFGLVGLLGRASGSDLDGLFRIGRAVSLGAGLLTSASVGLWIGRRHGAAAGGLGAALSLGAAPMFGYAVMARPDTTAEALGLAGLLLCGRRSRGGFAAGGVLLVLAVLAKQTAGVFALAAGAALLLEGRRRRSVAMLAGVPAAVAAITAGVALTVEPNFPASMLGEAGTPWEFAVLEANVARLLLTSPDLLLFPVLGLLTWARGAGRDPWPPALAVVLLATSVAASGKRGADLNYFLSLRIAEALAFGALWQASGRGGSAARALGLLAIGLAGAAAMLPGLGHAWAQRSLARMEAEFYRGTAGRAVIAAYRRAYRAAEDPRVEVLTDVGLVDIRRGSRTEFADPWLFKVMVETGRIRPTAMLQRIDSREYDLIITRRDLFSTKYGTYDFGLPRPVADAARARYRPAGVDGGLFYYEPRGAGGGGR